MSRMRGDSGPNERGVGEASSAGRAGSRPSLFAPLQRLVTDPGRLGTVNLWLALSAKERGAARRAYLYVEEGGR